MGLVQRNPLLSVTDRINAISNLLTNAEIFHDPSSLDVLGGSDAGGLLSARIEIVPDTDSAASSATSTVTTDVSDSSSATTDQSADTSMTTVTTNTDPLAGLVAAVNGETTDAVIGALETDSVASLDVTNYGSVYLGNGQFQDRVTGDITVQEGAADNPFYQVGNIYGYEGPLGADGEPLSPTSTGGADLTITLGGGNVLNNVSTTGAGTILTGGDLNGGGTAGDNNILAGNNSDAVTTATSSGTGAVTTIAGGKGDQGDKGDKGDQGDQGIQGEQGPGRSRYSRRARYPGRSRYSRGARYSG